MKDPTLLRTLKTSERRARQECSKCGVVRIAGQALTRFICKICGEEKLHANTAIPAICMDCAKAGDVCCRCGQPMD